ncbi:MAG: dihydroorotase [Verrucomicrobiales bacterium]|nr:dihydroorotase [Verrucomicrobiales bacterium]
MKRLYRNAQIASEDEPSLRRADVLVEADRILGVESQIGAVDEAEVIDCEGRILLPALFDLHVHAREPGQEHKENIASCAAAAIRGGFTGFLMMPDTRPAIDNGGVVQTVLESARSTAIGRGIYTSGAITKGRRGEELAGIAGMKKAGAVLLTDEDAPVANPQVLRRAMEYARDFAMPVASHGEVPELSARGSMHEGSVSYALGLQGMPALSEEIGIARDIRIAEFTGVHLHLHHVSTARGMQTIQRAKERGIHVTCEVTPHHLMFHHEHVGDFDTSFKTQPPLRTPEDNERLLEGLINGTFEALVTDHSPHTEFEKNQDFATAPFGITGLETALCSLYDRLIHPGRLGWHHLVRCLSASPRRLLGLPAVPIQRGGIADFVVFHPEASTRFDAATMRSKAINTPFLDQTLRGAVERVIHHGVELISA